MAPTDQISPSHALSSSPPLVFPTSADATADHPVAQNKGLGMLLGSSPLTLHSRALVSWNWLDWLTRANRALSTVTLVALNVVGILHHANWHPLPVSASLPLWQASPPTTVLTVSRPD